MLALEIGERSIIRWLFFKKRVKTSVIIYEGIKELRLAASLCPFVFKYY